MSRNVVLQVGKNFAQIMKLLSGMKAITIIKRINICMKPISNRNGDLFQTMHGWILYIIMEEFIWIQILRF